VKIYLIAFILFCSCTSNRPFDFTSKIGGTEDILLGEFGPPYFTTGLFENGIESGIVYGYKYNPIINTFYDASVDMHNFQYAKDLKIVLFHLVKGVVVDFVIIDGPIREDMFQSSVIRYFNK